MVWAKITSKGQVTIPKDVRDALKLRPGDRVSFRVTPGRTAEMQPQIDALELAGMFRAKRHLTIQQIDEAIGKAVVEEFRRSVSRGRRRH